MREEIDNTKLSDILEVRAVTANIPVPADQSKRFGVTHGRIYRETADAKESKRSLILVSGRFLVGTDMCRCLAPQA